MVVRLIGEGVNSKMWLDIGTGDGYTIRLVSPSAEIHGIDPDPAMAPLAQSRGILFKEGSAYHVPYEDGAFELITCIEVLEHLQRPEEAVREIRRVAAPGAHVVVTTPVPSAAWRFLWWGWTKLGPGKRWETTPHVSDLKVEDGDKGSPGLESLLKEQGFRVEKVEKCNYGMIAGLAARSTT